MILASSSPRRSQLLRQVGFKFKVEVAEFAEIIKPNETAQEAVMRFARTKAELVANKNPNSVVLAADTLGEFQGQILQKPKDLSDAFTMLKNMAGKSHKIFTAFTIIHKAKNLEVSKLAEAKVIMREFNELRIKNYLQTGESLDKAGAYGIQGFGAVLIKKLNGDFYTVMGLPLFEVITELEKFGVLPYS